MTIDRISPTDPINNYSRSQKVVKNSRGKEVDSVSVSEEARKSAEVYRATEVAKSAPEIRQDRIDEIKRKMENPGYPDAAAIEAVADAIMEQFKL